MLLAFIWWDWKYCIQRFQIILNSRAQEFHQAIDPQWIHIMVPEVVDILLDILDIGRLYN